MDTIDRIFELQKEAQINNKDLESIAHLANGSITNWKKRRYSPGVDAIINLAKYFNVTTDYLLCLSEHRNIEARNPDLEKSITEDEHILIEAYRSATAQGRFRIIQICMNEKREKETMIAG